MIRKVSRYKIIERDRFLVEIPFDAEITVKRGDQVKKGDLLYIDNSPDIIETYYLPKALGVKAEDADQYIGRVSGQLIEKGDLLAERITTAGMITKRVVAGVDGIVSTKRIKAGYIDIHSESLERELMSPVDGYIVEVKAGKYIEIESSSVAIDYFSAVNLEKSAHHVDSLTGEHVLSGSLVSIFRNFISYQDVKNVDNPDLSALNINDESVNSRVSTAKIQKEAVTTKQVELLMDSEIADFAGKIVYVGNFCQPDIIKELYKRQALAIIGNSMDYSDYKSIGLPIILLNGFGLQSGRDNYTLEPLLEFNTDNNLFIEVDIETKQLHILGMSNDQIMKFLKKAGALPAGYTINGDNLDENGVNPDIAGSFAGFATNISVGDLVISVDSANLGLVGKVTEVQELGDKDPNGANQDQLDSRNSQIIIVKRVTGERLITDTSTIEIMV
jgi:hypothetical protein